VDCHPPLVRTKLVNPNDNTDKSRVQWAVGLEIGRHIDAHSECVMTCLGGEIQAILRCIQRCAIFRWQIRVEGANADGLRQITSRVSSVFMMLAGHE
jgi:hypothetical protein